MVRSLCQMWIKNMEGKWTKSNKNAESNPTKTHNQIKSIKHTRMEIDLNIICYTTKEVINILQWDHYAKYASNNMQGKKSNTRKT